MDAFDAPHGQGHAEKCPTYHQAVLEILARIAFRQRCGYLQALKLPAQRRILHLIYFPVMDIRRYLAEIGIFRALLGCMADMADLITHNYRLLFNPNR